MESLRKPRRDKRRVNRTSPAISVFSVAASPLSAPWPCSFAAADGVADQPHTLMHRIGQMRDVNRSALIDPILYTGIRSFVANRNRNRACRGMLERAIGRVGKSRYTADPRIPVVDGSPLIAQRLPSPAQSRQPSWSISETDTTSDVNAHLAVMPSTQDGASCVEKRRGSARQKRTARKPSARFGATRYSPSKKDFCLVAPRSNVESSPSGRPWPCANLPVGPKRLLFGGQPFLGLRKELGAEEADAWRRSPASAYSRHFDVGVQLDLVPSERGSPLWS